MQIPDIPQRLVNPESSLPGFSVVVCTHERPRELDACLASLRRQRLCPAEIVVADNAPARGLTRVIAATAGAHYVAVPIRGVSRARNAGARQCRGRFIAFIDDDMVAHPEWLEGLMAAFQDPSVIAATGPVLSNSLAQAGQPLLREALAGQPWGSTAFRVGMDCHDWFERAHFGGLGDGNMAFRAEAFAHWPGFEERIGRGAPINGGEEHFAFFELIDRGHSIAYAPDAMVFHPVKEWTAEERLHSIAETAAYCCFVAANRPRYALRVARYLVQGLFGRRRAWRPAGEPCLGKRVTKTRAIRAFVRGMQAYRRSVNTWTSTSQLPTARRSPEATLQ